LAKWSDYWIESPSLELLGDVLGFLFVSQMTLVMLMYIFRERNVSVDLILGAVCGYLLIGILWAYFYLFLELGLPGSFILPQGESIGFSSFFYYSFVTLTTLGFGDIAPASPPARSFSVLEAISGQLYLAVLIGRLVGIHVSQSSRQ